MSNFDYFSHIRRILRKTSTFIGCIDSRGWILILIATVLAVCLGIYLYRRFVAKRRILPGTVQSALASTAEMLLIAAVVLGALLWPIKVHHPFGICPDPLNQILDYRDIAGDIAAGTFFASFVAVMGLLLLSRLRISATAYLLAYTTMFILGTYVLLGMTFLPAVNDIVTSQQSSPFARDIMPQIMLPGAAMQVLRMFVWAVVPFLLGIYFVRRGFAWWKFIAGSLLGGWLVSLIVAPVLMTMNLWLVIQPVVFTLTGAILVSLPRQRAAFERLFGFPLRRVDERAVLPRRLATTIIGHLLVVIVLFVLAGLLVVGYVDRQQIRLFQVGPPQNSRYPSFVDAYPHIHPLFLKGYPPASEKLAAGRMPDAITSVVLIAQGGFEDIRDEEGWARTNVPEMRKAFVELAPYFDAFTSASRCDYARLPENSAYFGFLPIREIARAMHSRAMVHVRDGNTTDAVHDIETIFGFAGIMKDFPSMVAEMISVAVSGLATDAAHQYYKVLRHNPLAMDQLAGVFDRQRENLRVELNTDAIRRGEPGMWAIATNVEIGMPAFLRADMNVRGRHMQIQMLEMAVALERFRNKHGHYPATQDELVPEFLRRVPLDPHRGKRYTYAVTGDDFTLTYSGPALDPVFEGPLEFPVPSLKETNARHEKTLQSTRPPDRRTTTSIATKSNTAATSSPR